MKKTICLMAIFAVFSVFTNTAICAPTTPPHVTVVGQYGSTTTPQQHQDPRLIRLTKVLKLTAEQEAQVKTLLSESKSTIDSFRKNIDYDYTQIVEAAIILPYTKDSVLAATTQLNADITSLTEQTSLLVNQIYSLLTEQQQAVFTSTRGLGTSLLH